MQEPHPEWNSLNHDEKLSLIREVVATDVAPSLERDGGGICVIDLVNEKEVTIAYRGACASCPMALYGTLGFIQHVISTKIHPDLVVVPTFADQATEQHPEL
jgi:NifU-like protein